MCIRDRRRAWVCLPRGRPEPLGRTAAPFGVGVLVREAAEHLLRVLRAPVGRVHFAQAKQRLRDDEGAREFLDDALEALTRGDRIALVQVVARDPELLLGNPATADFDLREPVAGVAAIGIVPDQDLEGGHGFLGNRLILLDGLQLVVVAPVSYTHLTLPTS